MRRFLNVTIAVLAICVIAGSVNRILADPPEKKLLCHREGNGSYNKPLELPPTAIDAHLDQHGNLEAGDFYPLDTDCDVTNDGGTTGTPDPGATPEPITILLLGAGVAGVGYASRRLRRNRSESDS